MTSTIVKLKPIVHFREYPFGLAQGPGIRDFTAMEPWPCQSNVLDYLRAGYVLGYPMGADLTDWLDPASHANPTINERPLGGATPMTDGEWFWPAALIYYVERYNVQIPQEFIDHAQAKNWRIDKESLRIQSYDYEI